MFWRTDPKAMTCTAGCASLSNNYSISYSRSFDDMSGTNFGSDIWIKTDHAYECIYGTFLIDTEFNTYLVEGADSFVCTMTPPCIPTTCAAEYKNCGTIPDGCGGTLNCGDTCPAGQLCLASHVCAVPVP